MTLNQFAAEKRLALFDDLQRSKEPREGSYDSLVLREARTKAPVQMGATRYTPGAILFEFVYPDALGAALILTVTVTAPQRIVFLPVPNWVIENIWQGEIAGAYHFEMDAMRLVRELEAELEPEANRSWFERQPAKRRE